MVENDIVQTDEWIRVSEFGEVTPFDELSFEIPDEWRFEYVPSTQALNLYDTNNDGSTLERSQIFIRYFDARSFLTLSTVTIHDTEDLTVGREDYVARRYDIEKKKGVPNFSDQPSWRSVRHIVTDFRAEDGFTRYYVVASRPDLDPAIYTRVLESMTLR